MATARKKESKTITFFQNGDRYFKGQVMVITPRRFRSLEVLLSELSRMTSLPHGVRYLLAIDDGANVQSLEDLRDGKAYVCSSSTKLKKLSYGNKPSLPSWSSRSKMHLPKIQSGSNSQSKSAHRDHRERAYFDHRFESRDRSSNVESKASIKPKIVTCIRNGYKPRAIAKVLLNKRTAQNLDQVLNQVSDSLGASGSTSNIRKLYSIKGQRVHAINELFQEGNDIFIAVGSEKFKPSNIEEIIADLAGQSKLGNHNKSRNTGMHKENKQRESKENGPSRFTPDNGNMNRHKSHSEEGQNVSQLPRLPKINQNETKNAKAHESKRGHVKPQSPSLKSVGKQNERSPRDKNANRIVKKSRHPSSGSVTLPPIDNSDLVAARRPEEKVDVSNENGNRKTVAVLGDSNTTAAHNKVNTSEIMPSNQGENERNILPKRTSHGKIRQGKISKDNTRGSMESEHEYCTITDKRAEDVYDIGRKLGDGNFAVVRECCHKITKKQYALKIIDKNKIKGKEAMLQDEIRIMRHCRHPNVVRLYEDYDTATEIYLVMELVKGGDLFDAISSSIKFTEEVASSYVRDVAKALHYLHKQHIVHRDLKPENLLLHKRSNGQTILKLADFGLAMEVKSPIFTVCGTPTYVAPEILEEAGYGLKVDMWAAGVITYIMLCGFPPFRSAKRDQDELFDLIQEGQFEFLSPYWDPVSDEAKDFVSHLLVVDVNQRYTAEQVLMHTWVRKRSATVGEISKGLLGDSERPTLRRRRRFKAAALAVQGAKRMENLAEQFHHQRGEKVIIT